MQKPSPEVTVDPASRETRDQTVRREIGRTLERKTRIPGVSVLSGRSFR